MTDPMCPPCVDCDQPATHQSVRDATEDEAAEYRQALNDFRAGQGLPPMPDDAPAMAHPVTVTVYHCCQHRPDDLAACDGC